MGGCLIIKNDGIGDLVLASGIISSIAERFDGEADLVTCGENREVAEGITPLRRRHYVSRDGMWFSGRLWSYGLLWPRVQAADASILKQVRSQRYDTAIVLRRFIRQNTLVIMQAVDAGQKWCAWQLPTNASPAMARRASRGWQHFDGPTEITSELSYARTFAETALGAGIDPTPRLSFCRPQSVSPNDRRIVLGLSGSSTNWQNGNWIELARLLADDGWKLTLIGGPNMQELSKWIVSKVPAAENRVGDLSIRETATLLEGCDAYIGNDSGISHLAALIVRHCLIIYGGGTFHRFFPWPGATNQTVVYHALDCFDCEWLCKFGEQYCLTLVRPHDVFAAFKAMITGATRPRTDVNLNPGAQSYELAWRHHTGIRMPFAPATTS